MKIEAKVTTLRCFEKIRFCMKYIAKNELVRILIARYCRSTCYATYIYLFLSTLDGECFSALGNFGEWLLGMCVIFSRMFNFAI